MQPREASYDIRQKENSAILPVLYAVKYIDLLLAYGSNNFRIWEKSFYTYILYDRLW